MTHVSNPSTLGRRSRRTPSSKLALARVRPCFKNKITPKVSDSQRTRWENASSWRLQTWWQRCSGGVPTQLLQGICSFPFSHLAQSPRVKPVNQKIQLPRQAHPWHFLPTHSLGQSQELRRAAQGEGQGKANLTKMTSALSGHQ